MMKLSQLWERIIPLFSWIRKSESLIKLTYHSKQELKIKTKQKPGSKVSCLAEPNSNIVLRNEDLWAVKLYSV